MTRREEKEVSLDTWSAPEWECNRERRGVTRRQRGSRVGERKRQMYRCLEQLEGWGGEKSSKRRNKLPRRAGQV